MEDIKIRFLQNLVEVKGKSNVSSYVQKLSELEESARKCYESLDSDGFIQMLLLDGCFIVQVIRSVLGKTGITEYFRYIFGGSFFNALHQDLLLVENQLPFFILWELFSMIESANERDIFDEVIFNIVCKSLHHNYCPKNNMKFNHLLDFAYQHEAMKFKEENQNSNSSSMRCATKLKEAGIKFKKVNGKTMFDISFKNGTLYIPTLTVGDYTESRFRNFVAFEQLFPSDECSLYVTDYAKFMDCLIDSPKDVEILCQNGIIENLLGDDQAVATMINSLSDFVAILRDDFYSEVYREVNNYCSRRWNRWMANLKHNYFNTPWALFSFLAATFLLFLTLLQTVFSVLK